MTGTEIINFFKTIVGDDWDGSDANALLLADQAKDTLETEMELQILLTEDSTLSRTSGDTDTTQYTVPTAASTIQHIYVGSNAELEPILFHERYLYTGATNKFTIDWNNRKFYILGTANQTETIHIFYIKNTDALTTSTSPVWPTKFHKLIPFEMARIFRGAIDYDDITARMTSNLALEANRIKSAMIVWDSRLKRSALGGKIPRYSLNNRGGYRSGHIPLN